MSRLACALSALLFGVVFAACVDSPALGSGAGSFAGADLKPSEGACGDFAHPCVLEGIEVRVQAPRTASAELVGAKLPS